MEGPSLYLAQKQLKAFKNQSIVIVNGNTKIGKERLLKKQVKDIFAWGKHLVFQFPDFAMRVHFLLFGTFEATINGVSVTGDYRRAREPRLKLEFQNGYIDMFNCSIKFIESSTAKKEYDFSIDIMSPKWNAVGALKNLKLHKSEEIADVLLDQTVFAGVGNIIKNEVLSILKIHPQTDVDSLSTAKLKALIKETHKFSHQFLKWREKFVLRKNLKIHRRSVCPHCGTKIIRQKTGKRDRWSYWCPVCQMKKQKTRTS